MATGELILSSTRGDELAGGRRGLWCGPRRCHRTRSDAVQRPDIDRRHAGEEDAVGIIGLVIWAESKAHKERGVGSASASPATSSPPQTAKRRAISPPPIVRTPSSWSACHRNSLAGRLGGWFGAGASSQTHSLRASSTSVAWELQFHAAALPQVPRRARPAGGRLHSLRRVQWMPLPNRRTEDVHPRARHRVA